MVQPGGRIANPRPQTTINRVQAQDEKANGKERGPVVLVIAFADMEGLEIGADPDEARDGNPVEEEKISRILAKEITRETGQARDPIEHIGFIKRISSVSSRIRRGSHRVGVGDKIWHSPCWLDRTAIHD